MIPQLTKMLKCDPLNCVICLLPASHYQLLVGESDSGRKKRERERDSSICEVGGIKDTTQLQQWALLPILYSRLSFSQLLTFPSLMMPNRHKWNTPPCRIRQLSRIINHYLGSFSKRLHHVFSRISLVLPCLASFVKMRPAPTISETRCICSMAIVVPILGGLNQHRPIVACPTLGDGRGGIAVGSYATAIGCGFNLFPCWISCL